MALQYKKINNKSLNNDISAIDMPPGVPGVSKNTDDPTEVYSGQLER